MMDDDYAKRKRVMQSHMKQLLDEGGHDGFFEKGKTPDSMYEIVVPFGFESNVKSAVDNSGAFSPSRNEVKFKTNEGYQAHVRESAVTDSQRIALRNIAANMINGDEYLNISYIENPKGLELHGPEIDMVESSRHDRHDRSLYGRGESLPEIGYDYIGSSVVFWYNEGQGIEDPFRVIKIVRRDASNEQLIEQIISEIGSNPGSMPEGIGRIHDAGGARAIGGADNGVDAVASWKDKGDDRTDVPSYGKDGVISEQVGNNKIVHSMPVGWNGLIL